MLNLTDPNTSYLIFTPENSSNSVQDNKNLYERACSILYSKDYTILSVTGHYNGTNENSLLAFQNQTNNDTLREDLIYLLGAFNQECGITKYSGESKATKIFNNGDEKPLSLAIYDSDLNNKTYLYNGISFSFIDEKRYYYPKTKDELKNGMVVEFFNNHSWVEKQIEDLNLEYQNLYQLLMKYNKVRLIVD